MFSGTAPAATTGAALARVFEPWAHLYADSKVIATVVTFGHIASLLMAGGLAVATDRATLRALRLAANERGRHLDDLSGVHRLVVGGLVLSLATRLLLFASDVETFVGSWVFWLKMAMICVLLGNGYAMTKAERSLRADAAETSPAWTGLRRAALVSVALWYAITLAGVALANVA
jgi:uncharacterized membrane protein